jgi:ATP-dependent Clp protease ATP-binding subunit ClpA
LFERFTDRARRVVALSQENARILNHNYIGTEHLLIAMAHEGEGVAAKVLAEFGITQELIEAQITRIIGLGQQAPSGHIPFTPRSKRVLELSLREALQLGHNYIGTEHLLLGLLREGEGVGAQILKELDVTHEALRLRTVQLLGYYEHSKLGVPTGLWEPVKESDLPSAPVTDEGLRLLADYDQFTARWREAIENHLTKRSAMIAEAETSWGAELREHGRNEALADLREIFARVKVFTEQAQGLARAAEEFNDYLNGLGIKPPTDDQPDEEERDGETDS